MKYKVETFEQEYRRYYFEVEAENKEDAEEQVRAGDVENSGNKFVSGEILEVKVEEVE